MKLNISLFLIYLVHLVYVKCSVTTTRIPKYLPGSYVTGYIDEDCAAKNGVLYVTRNGCIISTICKINVSTSTVSSFIKTEYVTCPPKSVNAVVSNNCVKQGGIYHEVTVTTSYNGQPCLTVNGSCDTSFITSKTIPTTKIIPTTTTTTTTTTITTTKTTVKTLPTKTTPATKCCVYPPTTSVTKTPSTKYPPFNSTTTTTTTTTTTIPTTTISSKTIPTTTTTTTSTRITKMITCPPKGGHVLISVSCISKGGIFYTVPATGTHNGRPCLTVQGGCDLSHVSTKVLTNVTTDHFSFSSSTTKTLPTKTLPITTTTTTTSKTLPVKTTTTTTTSNSVVTCPPRGGHISIYSSCKSKGGVYHETAVIGSYNGEPCLTVSASCDLSNTATSKTIPTKTIPTTTINTDTTTTTTTKTVPPITSTKCIPVTITVTEKELETVTLKETVTVTLTEESTSSAENDDKNCASKWAQCGGIGFKGPTCCKSGSICRKINDYYHQCY